MSLARRDARLTELMDDPASDPRRTRRTLERFGLVNAVVACWGAVYRDHFRPLIAELGRPAQILDIGCGGGDVLRGLVRLARRDGYEVEALGIDPDPRALVVARKTTSAHEARFRSAYSSTLVEERAQFDVVLSNHLLHHLDERQFDGLIANSETLSRALCVHSDIVRSRLAFLGFSVAAFVVAPGSFLRVDGLCSIRCSYTRGELRARLPGDWCVERPGAFRLLAVHRTRATSV